MAIWEYKVISSGKGGFATPDLLEKFLNDLGKQNWEIIAFKTLEDNRLAFNGLARRSTQRDWTLEDAAAAAAQAEAEKLRVEFEAKFKGLDAPTAAEEAPASATLAEKAAPDDGYRRPIDTSRDDDPDAPETDEWERLMEEDELPTFFEAIRPHMRRNQRGPGVSAGVDYLAKKWGFEEADVVTALKECGFTVPDDENEAPAYLEYDGDLFWVNINRRGELWINTKEKPIPVFRTVEGKRVELEEAPKGKNKTEAKKKAKGGGEGHSTSIKSEPSSAGLDASGRSLPEGKELLALIRPKMRRNRRDSGHSGSVVFLSRALKCSAEALMKAFEGLGLSPSQNKEEKPTPVLLDEEHWWLNRDARGGVWINTRRPKKNDKEARGTNNSLLSLARSHLTKKRLETHSQTLDLVAEKLALSTDDLLAGLVKLGLAVPEKPRQKPVVVETDGELFWISTNTKKEVSLNAKPGKAPMGTVGPGAPETEAATQKEPSGSKGRKPRLRRASKGVSSAKQKG